MIQQCGVVVIGRNEGERLVICLDSIIKHGLSVVYVDSGSTDHSIAVAKSKNCEIVELDMSIPFTAARARNEGYKHLETLMPEIKYVQFVDGDCEIFEDWFEYAYHFIYENHNIAVVCGVLRERYPEKSVYNMLCQAEWDSLLGEINACGGNSLVRVSAFSEVSGFREDLIAGEEPELCLRMRRLGWKIWRIDRNMALHDASIYYFSQWWKRAVRSGYAYSEGAYLHKESKDAFRLENLKKIRLWGFWIPIVIVVSILAFGWHGFYIFLIYPIQIFRISRFGKRSKKDNIYWAFFTVLGKFPEMIGLFKFHYHRMTKSVSRIIEYK